MRPIVDSEGVPRPVPAEKGGRTWTDAHVSLVRRTVGMAWVSAIELHRRLSVLCEVTGQNNLHPLVQNAAALRTATENMRQELQLDDSEIPLSTFAAWDAKAARGRKRAVGRAWRKP